MLTFRTAALVVILWAALGCSTDSTEEPGPVAAVEGQGLQPFDEHEVDEHEVDGSVGPLPSVEPLPSLCSGVNTAVADRSGLGDVLRRRGLASHVTSEAANGLGSVGTVLCYSDDIEGSVAVVLSSSENETGIALTNDLSWLNGLRGMQGSGARVLRNPAPGVSDHLSVVLGPSTSTPAGADGASGESSSPDTDALVHIDTLLKGCRHREARGLPLS